jgi:hypothetical protein
MIIKDICRNYILNPFDELLFSRCNGHSAGEEGRLNALGVDALWNATYPVTNSI